MENYSFKSVAFGGFDKQDVVRYLEQSSEKAAAAQRELEAENEMLHRQAADQLEELDRLRVQVEELTEQRDRLREKLETEAAVRADLEPLRALEKEAARLTAERDALKPDAQAYARFRERLGAIECEARKRADDLEEEAAAQTRRTVGETPGPGPDGGGAERAGRPAGKEAGGEGLSAGFIFAWNEKNALGES